jgi:sulfatase maturation enzyme AslB (radical SAM superfamily)
LCRYAATELLKIANDKKRSVMVMAVSELRQKKVKEIVRSCKNLIACHGVAPDSKLAWGVAEELQDIYSTFMLEKPSDEEVGEVRINRSTYQ